MGAWTARGGWSIEAIVLDRTPCYRVLQHGYRIAYCASLEELTELLEMNGLDLGDLVEDDEECELVPGMTKSPARPQKRNERGFAVGPRRGRQV